MFSNWRFSLKLVERYGWSCISLPCFFSHGRQAVGMKAAPEEVVMIEKLPAVGATAWSRFLPSVAEIVVEWRFQIVIRSLGGRTNEDGQYLNCNLFSKIWRQDRKSCELVCNLVEDELVLRSRNHKVASVGQKLGIKSAGMSVMACRKV